ncbi:MAG: chemotaxis protein CheA [Deltaproteobacteria bacterium]|nr:chemotaxis protein CheA [Deltaproteobacteria bacterium]
METDREALTREFLAESTDLLRDMEEALVTMEGALPETAAVDAVFRGAHTLKGNAGILAFDAVVELAHAFEGRLEGLRGRHPVDSGTVTLLLRGVDALRDAISCAQVDRTAALPPSTAQVLQQLRAAPGAATRAPTGAPADAAPPDERARTLRVDVARLDEMLNVVGEIAVARGRLTQALSAGAAHGGDELLEAYGDTERLWSSLQELVMQVRLVPVGPLFRQHRRTVRDLALRLGKRARLVLEGEDVELDTAVLDHLRDPLVHMVRNAVDHGLEPPEARVQAGKDPVGTVTLRARHDAGSLVIQVEDDGRGLDRAAILQRARERGLPPEAATHDADVYQLVLESGFSTAPNITDVSGRGVGLDVVRRNIEALRGTVTLDLRPGGGTRVTLRLPLTLAIIDGFRVAVGEHTFVIPMGSVVECLSLPGTRQANGGSGGVLNLRGEALPYLQLRNAFHLGGPSPTRESVVVVRYHGGRAGIAVDELLGQAQTVIKPLGPLFQHLPSISGSAILGNGRVALIVDVAALVRDALRGDAAPHMAGGETA